jgi:hypothetical protein
MTGDAFEFYGWDEVLDAAAIAVMEARVNSYWSLF